MPLAEIGAGEGKRAGVEAGWGGERREGSGCKTALRAVMKPFKKLPGEERRILHPDSVINQVPAGKN